MTPEQIRDQLETDEDFIALKRYEYSIAKLLEKHPDGCSDRVIAAALMIPEEEVEEIYQSAVARLRTMFGEED